MATSAKKNGNTFNNKKEQKSFGYTIGDMFDLYKMTGMKKPQKKNNDSSEKK